MFQLPTHTHTPQKSVQSVAEKQIFIQSAGMSRLSFTLSGLVRAASGLLPPQTRPLGGGEEAAGRGHRRLGGGKLAERTATRPGRGQGPRRSPRELTPSDSGWRGQVRRARSLLHTARCPAQRPRSAPTPRRARAPLLLPRRAPRLSFYTLFPAPISSHWGARALIRVTQLGAV